MSLFSDDQLKALVEQQGLDPARGSHAIVVTGDQDGVQVVVGMTFHGQKATWEVQGVGKVDKKTKFSGQARVVVQW